MAGDMWGGEGLLAGIQAQQAMGQIAMQPLDLKIKQNQVLREQRDLDNNQKMSQLLSGMGTAQTAVERVDQLAEAAAQSGMLDHATKFMELSATMRRAQATAGAAAARQKTSELDNTIKEAELFARSLDGSYDTPTFQAGVRTFEGMTGRDTGYANQPYSPELVDQLKQMSLSIKDKAELGIKNADLLSKEQSRSSAVDFREFRRGIELRKVQAMESREARLRANGGKPASLPNKNERIAAEDLIDQEFPPDQYDIDPTHKELAAISIASDAKMIQRANPSLGPDEAMRQALNKSKEAGDWSLEKRTWGKDREKFLGGGRTPLTAMSTPPTKDGLVKGRYYLLDTPKYKGPAKWNGSTFVTDSASAPSSADDGADTEDDSDEDDTK